MEHAGIYIHFPFCKRTCFYCHFTKQAFDSSLADRYIEALVKEIRLSRNNNYRLDTIYMGGGSPSLLNEGQTAAILDAIGGNFELAEEVETTVEMNPEDVTVEKLRFLKRLGVNRLSIGAQSFNRADLDYLRRTHGVEQSLAAVELALTHGFSNINADFIISLPHQTRQSLEAGLLTLGRYHIPHVSAYILEGVDEGEERHDRDHELYFFTREQLLNRGYIHYEISNFSKPGFQSRHNLKYWTDKSYIGVGLSAAGYENGADYKNTVDLRDYFAKIAASRLPRGEVSAPDVSLRKIITGLRLLEGIPRDHFSNHQDPLEFLLSDGFLVETNGNIAVSPQKLLLLNEILSYFY
jgi:oxygen-independent coproporphyrinogen-3 oxidase